MKKRGESRGLWSLFVRFSSFVLAAAGLALFGRFTTTVYAESPYVTVAWYSSETLCGGNYGAVVEIAGNYDLDSFTRDALPQEVSPSYHPEALKANAVMIRGVAYYHLYDPEHHHICSTIPGDPFYHLSTRRVQGWNWFHSGWKGIQGNIPNNKVTDTMAEVLLNYGNPFFYEWNPTMQERSNTLANQGMPYYDILYELYHNQYPGVGYGSRYTLYNGYRSMTNGTAPPPYPGWAVPGQRTDEWTPVMTAREAERHWGIRHMDAVSTNPFGQPGTYMEGWHPGETIAFLMAFGGDWWTMLHLIGIADAPGPVTMNVYVDGYYKGQVSWSNNDNQRHLVIAYIPNIWYGVHPIAIQFANDYWGGPGDPNLDRNLYLDVIGVSR